MVRFIRLTEIKEKDVVLVSVNHITKIRPTAWGSKVYLSYQDSYVEVKEDIEKIERLLTHNGCIQTE